jgi:1,4-alpha-glucan branching enzyme
MVRLFRFLWKLFVLASVFGVGYIIGREHSFEEEEEWDNDEDSSTDNKPEEKKDEPVSAVGEKMTGFEYQNEKATSVSIVGEFNDWNKDKTPMTLENGTWKASVSLKPGRQEYKFVVNNTDWITDPKCTETAPDKFGGRSSVTIVS